MLNDSLNKIKGVVRVQHYNKDNVILEDFTVENLVVNSGITFIIDRMVSNGSSFMSHMAVGTSSASTLPTDVALGNEIGREVFTSTSVSGNTLTFVAGFGAGVGTGVLTEAGIFNAASLGTMLNRVVFGSVNKGSLDTIVITWTLTVG